MPPSQLMSPCAVDRHTGLQLTGVIPAVVLGEAAIMPAPPTSSGASATEPQAARKSSQKGEARRRVA